MYDVTIHKGERASASKYYLNPAKKRELKNFYWVFCRKNNFEGKKAIGIEVKIKNKVKKIYANKEVILSGGSINSPHYYGFWSWSSWSFKRKRNWGNS